MTGLRWWSVACVHACVCSCVRESESADTHARTRVSCMAGASVHWSLISLLYPLDSKANEENATDDAED